jgi:hypothetical protein
MKKAIALTSVLGICMLGFFLWDKSTEKPGTTTEPRKDSSITHSLTPLEIREMSQRGTRPAAPLPSKSSKPVVQTGTGAKLALRKSQPASQKPKSSPDFVQDDLKTDVQRLEFITSRYSTATYPKLRQAVVDLGATLRPSELRQLVSFLEKTRRPSHVGRNTWFALQNEIMNKLRSQKPVPTGLARTFVQLASNQNLESGTREYALQHLSHLQSQLTDPREKAEIQSYLVQKIEKENGPQAGAALLAAYRAARASNTTDRTGLVRKAFNVAADSAAPASARTTALAICADERYPDALPLARKLAYAGDDYGLRVAAISALAKLGSGTELSILKSLSDDATAHSIVRRAAKTALANLQRKMISESSQS